MIPACDLLCKFTKCPRSGSSSWSLLSFPSRNFARVLSTFRSMSQFLFYAHRHSSSANLIFGHHTATRYHVNNLIWNLKNG
jgi:hypothetical protein